MPSTFSFFESKMAPPDESLPYISPYLCPVPSSHVLSTSPSSMVVECSDSDDEAEIKPRGAIGVAVTSTTTSIVNKQHPSVLSPLHQQESRMPRRRRTYQSYIQDPDEPPLERFPLPCNTPTRSSPARPWPLVPKPRVRRPAPFTRSVPDQEEEATTVTTMTKINISTPPPEKHPKENVNDHEDSQDKMQEEADPNPDNDSSASFPDWHDIAMDLEFDVEALFIDEDEISLDEALADCRSGTQLQQPPRRRGLIGSWFSFKK